MATDDELRDLSERIVQLSGRDQTRLLELVLAGNRRLHEQIRAEGLVADAALREADKRLRESKCSTAVPPEAKREAG